METKISETPKDGTCKTSKRVSPAPQPLSLLGRIDWMEFAREEAREPISTVVDEQSPQIDEDVQDADWNDLPDAPSGVRFSDEDLAAIKAGNAVPIWSTVLDCWCWWVRDKAAKQRLVAEGCETPTYTLTELTLLERAEPETLRELHSQKVQTGTTFEPIPSDLVLHGISYLELRREAAQDWPSLMANPALLDTFAHALATRRMRERGETPPDYTATTECAQCGPVPIFDGCPPKVLSCVWCTNRLAGRPMPVLDETTPEDPTSDPEAIAEREAIQAYEAEQEALLASDDQQRGSEIVTIDNSCAGDTVGSGEIPRHLEGPGNYSVK